MKIAWSTCHTGIIEHFSSMFSEHEIHVLGISEAWRTMEIVRQFNRNVFNHFEKEDPLEKIDISQYDVLIDSAECGNYNRNWRRISSTWRIPRIKYITHPVIEPVYPYYEQFRGMPTIYSNEQLQSEWKIPGEVIHFTADDWGIGTWTGEESQIIFGKNGFYTWGPPNGNLVPLFEKLKKKLNDDLYIHDSGKVSLSETQLMEMVRRKRAWFEHPFNSSGRAITNGWVQSACLGLPAIVWKEEVGQTWRFINGRNGIVTDSIDEVHSFAKRLLTDLDFAKECSKEMIRIYNEMLSWKVCKPRWEEAIKLAREAV